MQVLNGRQVIRERRRAHDPYEGWRIGPRMQYIEYIDDPGGVTNSHGSLFVPLVICSPMPMSLVVEYATGCRRVQSIQEVLPTLFVVGDGVVG